MTTELAAAATAPRNSAHFEAFGHALRSPWLRFFAVRSAWLLATLAVLAISTFSMVRFIPGDPAVAIAGDAAVSNPDLVDQIRADLGLDQPYLVQLKDQFIALLHGDLGNSFQTGQPVTDILRQLAPYTLELALYCVPFVFVVSVLGGMLAAWLTQDNRHPRMEVVFGGVTSVVGSVPEFFAATVLAFIFAVSLQWLPVAGAGGLVYVILPVLALSIRPSASIMRIVRVETLDVLSKEYIRTARAKRLPAWRLFLRHVLPNVLTASLTLCGLFFAHLIGAAIVVEMVFSRPGLGAALIQAVLARDYPLIQGIVLFMGLLVVVVNALVDFAIVLSNPSSLNERA